MIPTLKLSDIAHLSDKEKEKVLKDFIAAGKEVDPSQVLHAVNVEIANHEIKFDMTSKEMLEKFVDLENIQEVRRWSMLLEIRKRLLNRL